MPPSPHATPAVDQPAIPAGGLRLRRLAATTLAAASGLTLFTAATATGVGAAASGSEGPAATIRPNATMREADPGRRLHPLAAPVAGVPRLTVHATPLPGHRSPADPATPPSVSEAGQCPPVVVTHSGADFGGGSYIAQAGFVDGEIAAASFSVPHSEFPIRLDLAEMIFVTSGATVTTTTDWSLLVWEGTPATGTIVAEFSSDGVILPPIQMPPGTNGVNVQVLVDPNDPEQIIITNNGSATFSVGYRIDSHNQPPSLPCFFGPDPCCNAFPATDTDGLAEPSRNWLRGINCGPFGCPPNGGWANFAQLDPLCRPSGDWVIRATWTSLNCGGGSAGACCLPDGTCEVLLASECQALGGLYQGDNVLCGQVSCPDPVGACCIGTACLELSEAACLTAGGVFLGAGTDCSDADACNPDGACCIPATGGCVVLSESDCQLVGGVFQGPFTACGDIICFPEGACCLPDGTCQDGLSPEDCDALGGTFQGDGTACGTVDCPEPLGACCLQDGAVCLELTEADCGIVAGAWAGVGTSCRDGDADGRADDCVNCPIDLDGSGAVDFTDLLQVLSAWGDCPAACPEDLDGSGAVDFTDLLSVLSAFGPC